MVRVENEWLHIRAGSFVFIYLDLVPITDINSLRKHAYSKILKILFFQIKKNLIFSCSCSKHRLWEQPRRGGSNKYPQYMFLAK